MGSVPGKQSVASFSKYQRRAHHAGSWYSNDAETLKAQLDEFLQAAAAGSDAKDVAATPTTQPIVRAVICPHAGYSYSGPTAAYSYRVLQKELHRRRQQQQPTTIVVLHPSHHVYLAGCAVSGAMVLETPIGNLTVNDALRQEILTTLPGFSVMVQSDEEHEHSGEMQYPYLAHILSDDEMMQQQSSVTVLPIMCGALSNDNEATYGRRLAGILNRPEVLTVVSTDFCHWGKRFGYQPVDLKKSDQNNTMPIHEFIRQMDHRGMALISEQWHKPGAFADYLKETRNTICGRHAVAVYLQALAMTYGAASATTTTKPVISFVKYAQSSAATSMRDSSVSYAAAIVSLS